MTFRLRHPHALTVTLVVGFALGMAACVYTYTRWILELRQ